MKMMKLVTMTAAVLLCLGLAQAYAECPAPAGLGDGQAMNATAAPRVLEERGLLSAAGTPMSWTQPPTDGVSGEFLAAIKGGGNGERPQEGECRESGCWSCCYSWTTGWICARWC